MTILDASCKQNHKYLFVFFKLAHAYFRWSGFRIFFRLDKFVHSAKFWQLWCYTAWISNQLKTESPQTLQEFVWYFAEHCHARECHSLWDGQLWFCCPKGHLHRASASKCHPKFIMTTTLLNQFWDFHTGSGFGYFKFSASLWF